MKLSSCLLVAAALALGFPRSASAKTAEGGPFVLLLAGKPSHGPGAHEHNAGVQLFAKGLAQGAPGVKTRVYLNAEWPTAGELAQADAIVIYSDGQAGHVALQGETRLAELGTQMQRGAGLVCIHYAVEPIFDPVGWEVVREANGRPAKVQPPRPAERGSKGRGAAELQEWLGGYFEQFWSVNPHWTANFAKLPEHPISRGVQPFSTLDEWYFNMRFKRAMQGVTPILSDVPPPETMTRGEGSHAGNPEVKQAVLEEKRPQHVAWAVERADGGRGFGFTGGHFHASWGNENQRKLVLNAILWTAKVEVPASGVVSAITPEELAANLDPKPVKKK